MDRRATPHGTTLVWIDWEEAIIVRWADRATVERVRRGIDRPVRPTAGRQARLRLSFLEAVANHVPGGDDVHVVGPGPVRGQLERCLRDHDRTAGRTRLLRTAPADRLSERELVARVRELAGVRAAPEPAPS